MHERWSWSTRSRFYFILKLLAWAAYIPAVSAFMIQRTPHIFQSPSIALLILGGFVVVPGYLHLMWVINPGYFYRSKLRYSDAIAAQISFKLNESGDDSIARRLSPKLVNLVPRHGKNESAATCLSFRTDWDQWLGVAAELLGVRRPLPTTNTQARVEVRADRFRVLAGYLSPGVVLELPPSRIVGIWKGSEVPTIGSGQVLVLVVQSEDDLVLLPFRVHRWASGPVKSKSVPDLISGLEDCWTVNRLVRPAVNHLRQRSRDK
jgi:hypothetical protein